METKKQLQKEKKRNFPQFCKFQRTLGKINVLKIAAQGFEVGDFLNILYRFLVELKLFSLC